MRRPSDPFTDPTAERLMGSASEGTACNLPTTINQEIITISLLSISISIISDVEIDLRLLRISDYGQGSLLISNYP